MRDLAFSFRLPTAVTFRHELSQVTFPLHLHPEPLPSNYPHLSCALRLAWLTPNLSNNTETLSPVKHDFRFQALYFHTAPEDRFCALNLLCSLTRMGEKAKWPEKRKENDGNRGTEARGDGGLQGAINSPLIPNNSDYTDE